MDRLTDVDRAKGLAMLLVVFGHFLRDPTTAAGNEWYMAVKHFIYCFHMPFFMFLSGIIFFMKLAPITNLTQYHRHILKHFNRLMPAFFLFSIVVIGGKWCVQHFVHVDSPVTDFLEDLIKVFILPMHSASIFLWYIYVLFLFTMIAPLLLILFGGRIIFLIFIGVGLLFIPDISLLGIHQFCNYFIFFSLGGLAWKNWDNYAQLIDRYWVVLTSVFILAMLCGVGDVKMPGLLISGLLSIPALHGLCRKNMPELIANSLIAISAMLFPIYLMNTMCTGAVKTLLSLFVPCSGITFIVLYIPLLMIAGILGPIYIKRYLIKRVGWLDRITS